MIEKKKSLNLDEIISIEDVGIQDTYDFTIPETHCYFANNILVHNSIEEVSDTVLLIWNQENKTSLLVEKQRHGPTGNLEVNHEREYYKFTDKSFRAEQYNFHDVPDETDEPTKNTIKNFEGREV